MTKEEIILGGMEIYNNCKILIKSLCLNVTDVLNDDYFYNRLNEDGKKIIDYYRDNFSLESELVAFDYIIQALLLCEALADGEFCEAEKEFITSLANENNLMDIIDDMDWDTVYEADADKQKEILEILNNCLNDITDSFIDPIALLDAFTTQDVLLDLSSQLSIISSLLGNIDGEFTEDEKEAFDQYADELLLGKWADIKGLVQVK